jgi:hypothetical protein
MNRRQDLLDTLYFELLTGLLSKWKGTLSWRPNHRPNPIPEVGFRWWCDLFWDRWIVWESSQPIPHESVFFRSTGERLGCCSVPFRKSRILLIDIEHQDVRFCAPFEVNARYRVTIVDQIETIETWIRSGLNLGSASRITFCSYIDHCFHFLKWSGEYQSSTGNGRPPDIKVYIANGQKTSTLNSDTWSGYPNSRFRRDWDSWKLKHMDEFLTFPSISKASASARATLRITFSDSSVLQNGANSPTSSHHPSHMRSNCRIVVIGQSRPHNIIDCPKYHTEKRCLFTNITSSRWVKVHNLYTQRIKISFRESFPNMWTNFRAKICQIAQLGDTWEKIQL